jgi:hypothetical protein
MRLIVDVYIALRTFDRPATVRELQREAGLERDEVHQGLRGLNRRHLIVKDAAPRQTGTYRLVSGAELPQDLRGHFERDERYREKVRRARLAYCAARAPTNRTATPHHSPREHGSTGAAELARFSVAAASNPSNAPGALRVIVKGVLDLRAHASVHQNPPCALADLWKKR